jgi:predicted ATPase
LDALPGIPGSEFQYLLGFNPLDFSVEQEALVERAKASEERTLFSLDPRPPSQGYHPLKVLVGGRMQEQNWGVQTNTFLESGGPYSQADYTGPLRALNGYFQGFRGYYFKPDKLKTWGPATQIEALARDGSNFASYLHHVLSGYRKYFDRIQEQLIKNFPEVEELLSPLASGNMTEVGIRERWFPKKSASGVQLSDGLVGFLAHLVVLYGPDEPTLVSFEEPENYFNPKLLERLVDMLKEASKGEPDTTWSPVQILISSHSVPMMDYLELEDLVVVERPEGGTTARRFSERETLRKSLKGWALGEAYASGALDATS